VLRIQVDLAIRDVSIESLSGIENLHSIGGSLIIDDVSGISNLLGLSCINNVGQDIVIGGCDSLTSLNGSSSIDSIHGGIHHYNRLPDLKVSIQ